MPFSSPRLALAATLLVGACAGSEPTPAAASPWAAGGSRDCVDCHAAEVAAWTGSHHDLAMQEASEATVLGDFDDAVFEHRGLTTRFFRRDGRYFVNTEGPDGELADFEVRYTFGALPLQQYLVELGGGRLQALSVVWDVAEEHWYTLYPDERIEPGDPLHWTGLYQRWNAMCAECHSTDLRKGYDLQANEYATRWHEIDVACEACHGPAAKHVAWAREDPAGDPGPNAGLSVALARGVPEPQIDACAPCHARRTALVEAPVVGAPFLDQYAPARLVPPLYHPDGQMFDEVYVYGSFMQSKMHRRGVGCTDCHDPHSLELLRPGDSVCLQCHTPNAPVDRFPTLQKKSYESTEHHHHALDSPGASCVACHMPARTYMGIDSRREHAFRIPRPDLTVSLGTPNTCGDCHAEEGPEWAAERVREWAGHEPAPHFAEALARASFGDPRAWEPLSDVAGDPEQPGIVRATALDLLCDYAPNGFAAAQAALTDADPLVRAAAVTIFDVSPDRQAARGQESLRIPAAALVPLVGSLLEDPVRSVRIEVARVLAELDADELPENLRAPFESALEEFRAAQRASADMPWSHLNLAVLHQDRDEPTLAEREYRHALRLDPAFLPARFNLSRLLNVAGRNAEAETVLREGLERYPDEGQLWYSLGLLLAEMERMEDCADALTRAAELLPGQARIAYNAGLALQGLGRLDEAERLLLTAVRRDPSDPDIQNAVALFYVGQERWDEALPFAAKLVELVPEAEGAKRMLDDVRKHLQQ